MNLIEVYRKDNDEHPGTGIWLWWGYIEDIYFTAIKTPEYRHDVNRKRWKRFVVHITFFWYAINIRIPIKHIGTLYHGRDLKR